MTNIFKGLVATAAAFTLAATPAIAAPASPAASLSVAKARAASPTVRGSKIAAGGTATLINIGILAGLAAIVLVATTGGDDDSDSN
ncbi:hypothetical protein [Sphingomonas mollis]|uniref:Uncharacterized protein n=1 Tax=Sphingomonas mollis TaxID=2795726 RepID=A0ABS0XQ90_9SPHN|nr:hypothetical protein [Sphingomonas sp. BT553]MBJ6122194.1 hypothetical protein [Sphingomonas sp. BT553]